MWECGLDSSSSEKGPVVGIYEHSKALLGSVRVQKVLDGVTHSSQEWLCSTELGPVLLIYEFCIFNALLLAMCLWEKPDNSTHIHMYEKCI